MQYITKDFSTTLGPSSSLTEADQEQLTILAGISNKLSKYLNNYDALIPNFSVIGNGLYIDPEHTKEKKLKIKGFVNTFPLRQKIGKN